MVDEGMVSEDNIRSYRDLDLWQRAMDFTLQVHRLAEEFPPAQRFGLTSQIQRSAMSVPSNIAEGWGRGGNREFAHFLRIARGSLAEAETQLILAVRLQYVSRESAADAWLLAQRVGQMITQLLRSIESRTTD